MYDELIERLRETSIDFGESDDVSVMMIEAANAIEDLITALTASNEVIAKNKPKWIPVTERLPEEHNRVLVYSKATRMGRGIDFINADGNWYTTPKVSHWMPLPQPPERDGE